MMTSTTRNIQVGLVMGKRCVISLNIDMIPYFVQKYNKNNNLSSDTHFFTDVKTTFKLQPLSFYLFLLSSCFFFAIDKPISIAESKLEIASSLKHSPSNIKELLFSRSFLILSNAFFTSITSSLVGILLSSVLPNS